MSVFDSAPPPEGGRQPPPPSHHRAWAAQGLSLVPTNPKQRQRNRRLLQLLAASSSKASPKYAILWLRSLCLAASLFLFQMCVMAQSHVLTSAAVCKSFINHLGFLFVVYAMDRPDLSSPTGLWKGLAAQHKPHKTNPTHKSSECECCAAKALTFTHESSSNSCNFATPQTCYKFPPPQRLCHILLIISTRVTAPPVGLLPVTAVVPDRLCLNICARAETAAQISTFLILELWRARAPICTCLVTQIDLDETPKRRSKHRY